MNVHIFYVLEHKSSTFKSRKNKIFKSFFSSFDRDPLIIMKWFQQRTNSRKISF